MINKGIRENLYCICTTKATKGAFINKGFGVLEFRQQQPLFSPDPLVALKCLINYPYSLIFQADRNLFYRRPTDSSWSLTKVKSKSFDIQQLINLYG